MRIIKLLRILLGFLGDRVFLTALSDSALFESWMMGSSLESSVTDSSFGSVLFCRHDAIFIGFFRHDAIFIGFIFKKKFTLNN